MVEEFQIPLHIQVDARETHAHGEVAGVIFPVDVGQTHETVVETGDLFQFLTSLHLPLGQTVPWLELVVFFARGRATLVDVGGRTLDEGTDAATSDLAT